MLAQKSACPTVAALSY